MDTTLKEAGDKTADVAKSAADKTGKAYEDSKKGIANAAEATGDAASNAYDKTKKAVGGK